MARKAVIDAVAARLASWSAAKGVPVLDMNRHGDTPEGAEPFVLVQYPIAEITRPVQGQRHYRETGAFRIVIHTERGIGMEKAAEWSDEIGDLFRDQKFGRVETTRVSSPAYDDSSDRGNYFVAVLVVEFTHQFTA